MPSAKDLLPNMAGLRRYARAITGQQLSGDRYAGAALEIISAAESETGTALDPKVELYRAFTRLWQLVDLLAASPLESGTSPHGSDIEVQMTSPLMRQALLLFVVEDFDATEIAEILDITLGETRELLRCATHCSDPTVTTVLIIEDEPLIALDLAQTVSAFGHRVLGTARTKNEAITMIRQNRPGLILSDIQLADGSSGLEAVNETLVEVSAPVIFVTAFPERLLTGERPEPTFLMVKPFKPAALKAMITQALFFDAKARKPPLRPLGPVGPRRLAT